MTITHIDDETIYEGMINDGSDIRRMKKERDDRHIEQEKALVINSKRTLEEIALSKNWGKRPRVVQSAWDEDFKRTRYTQKGKEALREYSKNAREIKVKMALEEYHAFSSGSVLGGGGVTGMSVAEVNDIRTFARFKEELGGSEVTEKMSDTIIQRAVYNRKHMDKGYSVFEGGMDFLDACTKVCR
jgi:hypothetical protein